MLLNKERAYQVMDKHGLDGLVATTPVNIYYLTDYWGPFMNMRRQFYNFALLPRREDAPAALIGSAVEFQRLHENPDTTWVPNVCAFSHPTMFDRRDFDPDTEDPEAVQEGLKWPVRESSLRDDDRAFLAHAESYRGKYSVNAAYALKKAIKDAGLENAKLGTDDPRAVTWMNEIGLKNLKGTEATHIFREIRMIKSAPELAIIRKAAAMNEIAVDAAIASLHVGQLKSDLEIVYNTELAKRGGKGLYLSTGSRGKRQGEVELDEMITFDGLCEYKHYCADMGRTAIVGTPTEEMLSRNHAMKIGCDVALGMIKPGVTGRAVTEAVIAAIEKEGFPGFVIVTPHSVGLEHTDHPLPIGTQLPGAMGPFTFQENMVFTLDMPYHEIGWGNMHLEDLILVTKTGVEPLNSCDVKLRVIPADKPRAAAE
ncbi:MAG: aminopeptidase P family protein [Rhodobacteraceae bacterium]|nr:aminopeptidase P family protein [Paracoccaceae bacterium]